MKLTKSIAGSALIKMVVALSMVSAVLLLQGCGHHTRTAKFASHKVTVDRSGITNRFGVEERENVAIFHYDGYAPTAGHLKVKIENEKVTINDRLAGMLKVGDEIHINGDGVTVNSLDHGETEKYLQENLKQVVTQNIAK